jgi:hypothetical protein
MLQRGSRARLARRSGGVFFCRRLAFTARPRQRLMLFTVEGNRLTSGTRSLPLSFFRLTPTAGAWPTPGTSASLRYQVTMMLPLVSLNMLRRVCHPSPQLSPSRLFPAAPAAQPLAVSYPTPSCGAGPAPARAARRCPSPCSGAPVYPRRGVGAGGLQGTRCQSTSAKTRPPLEVLPSPHCSPSASFGKASFSPHIPRATFPEACPSAHLWRPYLIPFGGVCPDRPVPLYTLCRGTPAGLRNGM